MKTCAEIHSILIANECGCAGRGRYPRAAVLLLSLLMSLLVLSACMSGRGSDDADDSDAAGIDENAAEMPADPGAPSAQDLPEVRQLVIWAPDFWVANDETPAGGVVGNAIVQFEQVHDGTKIEIHTKAESGTADMLSTLRSAQRVAPAVLPDALLIDTQDIWQLVELGLAQPLTETLDLFPMPFYPFAEAAVRHYGDVYGIPYAADLVHVSAVDPLERELPASWDDLLGNDLLDGERRYLFPAAGRDGRLSLLLQYAGMNGDPGEAMATADQGQLAALYEFYAEGASKGVIPPGNVDLTNFGAAMKAMDMERSDLIDTSTRMLLRQNEAPADLVFAPAPTQSGRSTSVAQTWAFVILTGDPGQRAQVLDLVQMLLDPNVQGAWSKFARLLPTTYEAAATWDVSQPYSDFVLTLLDSEETYAVPNGRAFSELLDDMQTAQQAVLNGQMTAEEAAGSVRPAP